MFPRLQKFRFGHVRFFNLYFNQNRKEIQLIDSYDIICGRILDITMNSKLDFYVNNGIHEEILFIFMNKELNIGAI